MLLLSSSLQFAKAKSCLLTVQMARDFGWNYCILEGVALVVTEACRNPDSCPREIYPVVSCIVGFTNSFVAWDFVFVKREVNLFTHLLAAKASHCFSGGWGEL